MANQNDCSQKPVRRLLCFLLIFAMLLSVSACGSAPVDPSSSVNTPVSSTAPSTGLLTQPSTIPTMPSSVPEPSQPEEPEDPAKYELVYTLTQEAVDEFYRLLEECEDLSVVGEDMDAIEATMEALDEAYLFLEEQCSIATIFHYSHMADKDLEQQYLDSVEICTEANDAYLQMARRVYLSDTPAKDTLFEGWTEEDIDSLLAYDEQIADIQQRNAEIGVENRATNDDARKIELYIEFIQNNNTIAQYYDYDNYYTYAYERVYSRDYGMEELERMRQYAKTYLVYDFYTALNNFYAYFTGLDQSVQVNVQNFLFNNYNEQRADYVGMYVDATPESLQKALRDMLDHDSLFTEAVDARQGAFTTMIGERSYCYFGPGYWSSTTVMHEGGHYYASRYSDLNNIPLDLAEVHSQANEWLFVSFLRGRLSNGVQRSTVDYRLYENIAMTLICLMVDEFEQVVYNTDLTGFTAEELDAIMDQIAESYFPDGNADELLADMNAYWRQVVVDQPIYYISYAVSGIAAIGMFTEAEKDFDHAMAIYQKLCEEPVLEEGFLGNILSAGLPSPFDEDFYQQLHQLLESRKKT